MAVINIYKQDFKGIVPINNNTQLAYEQISKMKCTNPNKESTPQKTSVN